MKKILKYILLICAFTLSISYANKIAVATKIKGLVEVNGVTVDESSLNYLLNQISSNAIQIQSISVE